MVSKGKTPQTRSMKENDDHINYIDNKFNEIKDHISNKLKEELLKEISALLDTQKVEIKELKESVEVYESTTSLLQGQVSSLKLRSERLLDQVQPLEKYSRRQTLRIDGIEYCPNENEKTALDHINTWFEEAGVVIPDVAVDIE